MFEKLAPLLSDEEYLSNQTNIKTLVKKDKSVIHYTLPPLPNPSLPQHIEVQYQGKKYAFPSQAIYNFISTLRQELKSKGVVSWGKCTGVPNTQNIDQFE